jgi:hypothetical protein
MSGNESIGNVSRNRSIYGRGYFDGFAAGQGGSMTPKRQQQLLQGQSSVARKVFDHIPIQDSWPAHRIAGEIERTTRSRLDAKVVAGCLASLVDAGLIRQKGVSAKAREYQRLPVPSETTEAPGVLVEAGMAVRTLEHVSATPDSNQHAENPATPFVVLSTLNDRLFQVSQELKEIATDLGDAVLQIESAREQNARDAETLRQLQTLLGGLSSQK